MLIRAKPVTGMPDLGKPVGGARLRSFGGFSSCSGAGCAEVRDIQASCLQFAFLGWRLNLKGAPNPPGILIFRLFRSWNFSAPLPVLFHTHHDAVGVPRTCHLVPRQKKKESQMRHRSVGKEPMGKAFVQVSPCDCEEKAVCYCRSAKN